MPHRGTLRRCRVGWAGAVVAWIAGEFLKCRYCQMIVRRCWDSARVSKVCDVIDLVIPMPLPVYESHYRKRGETVSCELIFIDVLKALSHQLKLCVVEPAKGAISNMIGYNVQ